MKRIILAAMVAMSGCATVPTPSGGDLRLTERIAGIQRYAASEGGKLWPGFDTAPFSFLLIEEGVETLYCREPLPDGVTPIARNAELGCNAATRSRSQLPARILAAMPLFGPPSTIVMGTPEGTGRTPAEWTRIILHEHFHQWQDGLPDLYPRMNALDLAGGDETGMWMINFAFPYDAPAVMAAQANASIALATAVRARGTPQFGTALTAYLRARTAFANAAGERNWRYAEMQLWKEGVARWTEVELGKRHPDAAVRASAQALEARGITALDTPDLAKAGREFVYPYGAAEAMLLEACDKSWRKRYPSLLALGPLLDQAATRCGG